MSELFMLVAGSHPVYPTRAPSIYKHVHCFVCLPGYRASLYVENEAIARLTTAMQ